MSDWSDEETVEKPKTSNNNYDNWKNEEADNNRDQGNFSQGRGRGRGGRGSYSNDSNRGSFDNNENGDSREGGFRGRGRGRGRGSYSNDSDRNSGFENDNDNGDFHESGFRGRGRGRGRGFSSNNSDRGSDFGDDQEGGESHGFRGRGRGRGGFRGGRFNSEGDGSERSQYNDQNDGEDNGEKEQKRELYIPPEPTTNEDEMFGTAISAGINFDAFDEIDVHVTGQDAEKYSPISSFQEGGFREFIQNNIDKCGYKKPTPIQKRAIPIIMAKRDLMGCAQTGSGKTAAFILPILNMIMNENNDLNPGKPQCLIVGPTRELVIQIYDEARKFALKSWVKVTRAYGGTATRYQSDDVSQGCHILVATPGRLMDFVNRAIISFDDLRFLVLDEADRMLDMGFRQTIDDICNHETLDKNNCTTLMFSATFPEAIQILAGKYLRNYLFLTVGIVGGACKDVEQEFILVTKFKKREMLGQILETYCNSSEEDRILVFVETKRTADFLASFMSETKISTTSIHGDRLQRERETALQEFRKGIRKVLISTSVAARGLDIKGVTHVINYDLPKDIDEYIHRIGRTGRVGNRGKATSFYDPDVDGDISRELVRILQQAGQPIPDFFTSSGSYSGEADRFGGTDVRKPVRPGSPQQEEEDW